MVYAHIMLNALTQSKYSKLKLCLPNMLEPTSSSSHLSWCLVAHSSGNEGRANVDQELDNIQVTQGSCIVERKVVEHILRERVGIRGDKVLSDDEVSPHGSIVEGGSSY